jgi:hypothetical protein
VRGILRAPSPAGSFLGGFRTPATGVCRADVAGRHPKPSTLPDSCAAAQDLQGPVTIAKLVNIALLNSEAAEEFIPAGAAEVALAATARVHSESWLATLLACAP